jgi:hypothetical protein
MMTFGRWLQVVAVKSDFGLVVAIVHQNQFRREFRIKWPHLPPLLPATKPGQNCIYFCNAFPHKRIEKILDNVISPASQELGNDGPPISVEALQLK